MVSEGEVGRNEVRKVDRVWSCSYLKVMVRNLDFFLSAIESHWTPVRLSAGILQAILQARGEWDDIFKILKY